MMEPKKTKSVMFQDGPIQMKTSYQYFQEMSGKKADSQDDEVVRAKKSHFKADLKVYVAMGVLLLAALGIVIAKVTILDASEDPTVSTFLPIKQEKNSNAKYVGGGFIPHYPGY